MSNISERQYDLYKSEIKELTSLLMNEWTELRDDLIAAGLSMKNVYLVAFLEDEEEDKEIGVLLYSDNRIIKFEKGEKLELKEIESSGTIMENFPQIVVGIDMIRNDL